jgi:hypothetical protein
MPGFLVQQSAQISCLHQGKATTAVVSPRVRLGGSPVLIKSSVLTIVGCALPPPPAANGPDVSGTWMTNAVRVKSLGMPVILSDSQAICAASGLGVTIIAQARVKGI